MQGTQAAPVVGVLLEGLSLTATAATFMQPFVAPSGGDWSAHVGGAVVLNGTEGCTLAGATVASVGGSGVALTGYNRGATITGSEFAWLGEGGWMAGQGCESLHDTSAAARGAHVLVAC